MRTRVGLWLVAAVAAAGLACSTAEPGGGGGGDADGDGGMGRADASPGPGADAMPTPATGPGRVFCAAGGTWRRNGMTGRACTGPVDIASQPAESAQYRWQPGPVTVFEIR